MTLPPFIDDLDVPVDVTHYRPVDEPAAAGSSTGTASRATVRPAELLAFGREVLDAVNRSYTRDGDGKFSHTAGSGGKVADLPKGPVPTVQAAAQGTNPGYGQTADGPTYREAGRAGERWSPDKGPPPSGAFEENCTNAVMAFEMRMRGHDVHAAPLDVLDKHGYAGGRTDKQIDDLLASGWRSADGSPHGRSFSGQKWRRFKDIDAEIARDWPEGGRGFINVGKHVFSVVKRNGKAHYVEAQYDASPTRTVTGEYKKKFKAKQEEAKVIRLDDLSPTDGIFEAVTAAR